MALAKVRLTGDPVLDFVAGMIRRAVRDLDHSRYCVEAATFLVDETVMDNLVVLGADLDHYKKLAWAEIRGEKSPHTGG